MTTIQSFLYGNFSFNWSIDLWWYTGGTTITGGAGGRRGRQPGGSRRGEPGLTRAQRFDLSSATGAQSFGALSGAAGSIVNLRAMH